MPPRNPALRSPWHSWCMASIPPMGLQCLHVEFSGKEITCSIIFAACSADLYPVLLSICLKQILNITRSQAGSESSPSTVAVVSLGAGRGEGAVAFVSFPCWVSKLNRGEAAVVAHPRCRMAASCLCLEHGFPNTTEFLCDDPKCCLCSRPLQSSTPVPWNGKAWL